MRRMLVVVLALLTAIVTAPVAHAGDAPGRTPNLKGTWNSAALRMDGVGWSMKLTPACTPPNCYDAVLLFNYQDGTTGLKKKLGVVTDGGSVSIVYTDGSTRRYIKGTLGQDGSLFFPKCYTILKFATKANADETCLFQELPV